MRESTLGRKTPRLRAETLGQHRGHPLAVTSSPGIPDGVSDDCRDRNLELSEGRCRVVLGGPGPLKRGDHGRRRTTSRIKHGGGDGGGPVRSPPRQLGFCLPRIGGFSDVRKTSTHRRAVAGTLFCHTAIFLFLAEPELGRPGRIPIAGPFRQKTSSHTDHPPSEALTTLIRYSDVIDKFQQTANIVTAESQVKWLQDPTSSYRR